MAEVKGDAYKRFAKVLKAEGYEFVPEALVAVINRHYPDFRKTIRVVQKLVQTYQRLDAKAVASEDGSTLPIKRLVSALKGKTVDELTRWSKETTGSEPAWIIRTIFDSLSKYAEPDSIPVAIEVLGDCLYKCSLVADNEIQIACLLMQLMREVRWL
jgi:hypothetical protein